MADLNFYDTVILENKRALLRPLQVNDLSLLLPVASADKDLVQFSPAFIHTPEYLKEYILHALNEKEKGLRYPFIIFDKSLNEFAGSTSYLNISNKDLRLEIGSTWIGKKFQRTGLNRNCKYLLIQYAFESLDFERIEFRTDERNNISRTAIEKIGGKFEGNLRSHTLMNDGFRRNTVCYSILKNEWQDTVRNCLSGSIV